MTKTVLLVEDDLDARAALHDALADRGFRVVTGIHGAEGVHLARRHRPDLMIMELRMPVMDGRQAIRYVRADPMTTRIPVWAMSACKEDLSDEDRVRAAFDRLIEKPVDPVRVAEEVERELGRTGGALRG